MKLPNNTMQPATWPDSPASHDAQVAAKVAALEAECQRVCEQELRAALAHPAAPPRQAGHQALTPAEILKGPK